MASAVRQVLLYAALLVTASLALVALRAAGAPYAVAAVALGAWLMRAALRLRRTAALPDARRLFGVSIAYLFLLFAALSADVALRG